MKRNMGTMDRVIRAVIGAAAAGFGAAWVPGFWAWILYAVAAVLLVTAAVGSCPVYTLFGWSTRHTAHGTGG